MSEQSKGKPSRYVRVLRTQAEFVREALHCNVTPEAKNVSLLAGARDVLERCLEDEGESARERLPDERDSITHHFVIHYAPAALEGVEGTTELLEIDGYIHAGVYADGRLGEVFIRIAKMGEETSGTMDGLATTLSLALQCGAPLEQLCSKYVGTKFSPYGATNNPAIPRCTSLLDYLGRWLAMKFLGWQGGQPPTPPGAE